MADDNSKPNLGNLAGLISRPAPAASPKDDAPKITPDAEQPEVPTPATKSSFFLRNGTNLRFPLTIPNFGEFEVVFENATVTLGAKLATALREELKRNIRLSQNVYEYNADDKTVQAIVAHHTKSAATRNSGSSGVEATQNNHLATDFRDPSLYTNQPTGRHADVLLRGRQSQIATD